MYYEGNFCMEGMVYATLVLLTTRIMTWYHILRPTFVPGLQAAQQSTRASRGTNQPMFKAQLILHPTFHIQSISAKPDPSSE
jgi:hypothetical protein